MPAIITSRFRLENASNFKEAVGTDSVYLAIGKSDNWSTTPATIVTGASGNGTTVTLTFSTSVQYAVGSKISVGGIIPSGYNGIYTVTASSTTSVSYASSQQGSYVSGGSILAATEVVAAPTPVDTLVDQNDFWQNAIALKKVDESLVTHIIPRYNWTAGQTYVPWDDASDSIFTQPFYVITNEFKVYKLISKSASAGNVSNQPTHTTATSIDTYPDGYTWKYMYTVTAAEATAFMTNQYMPVKTVVIPAGQNFQNLSPEDQSRYNYQNSSAADSGKIYRIIVTSGGTGYTSAPTVNIKGNGSGASATAFLSGTSVSHIVVDNPGNSTGNTPYNVVTISFSGGGGSGATARAILSPKGGHGTDPVSELGGFFIGIRTVLNGPEGSGDFIVSGAEFRQIALIKNPYNLGTTTISTGTTLSVLKVLTLSSGSTGGFKVGDFMTDSAGSGAVAYIDSVDADNGIIKYHQNDKTGYVPFTVGMTIVGATAGSGTIGSLTGPVNSVPDVEKFSGEVMFVENRLPISRSGSQLEDIKMILEF